MIYLFNESKIQPITQIGGKAKALCETTNAGFPVPEGFALSVEFFRPWLEVVKGSEAFDNAMANVTNENCDAVKELAESQRFNDEQRKSIEKALSQLDGQMFAVRSSSPEEDLEGASFAGMYETYLGTEHEAIESTVAKAFASCFDYRVMAYKNENGIDLRGTSIAVVVQRQIDSDVSGVGFSLNPLNNSYDEVVINASHGLGEAIVSGLVTPDKYVVNTVKGIIAEKNVNLKEIALKLDALGGITEIKNDKKDDQALNDEQILELTSLIKKCETYYGMPMDTEWAYESGKLYLLQSRPITTYFPVYKELMTEPGEKLKYYVDLMMLTQGIQEPMSVLGTEIWADMVDILKGGLMTPYIDGSAPAINGRHYLNVTAFGKLVGEKGLKRFFGGYDGNLRKIVGQLDFENNRYTKVPAGTKDSKKRMFVLGVKMLPSLFKAIFGRNDKLVIEYNDVAISIMQKADGFSSKDDFEVTIKESHKLMEKIMVSLAAMFSGMIAYQSITKMFKGHDVEQEIAALSMDLEGNPTSEMGHLMFKMACTDDFKGISSKEDFCTKCDSRAFSDEFLVHYDTFMKKYSCRGILEVDVASKRVNEDVGILYDKLIDINTDENQILTVKQKRQEAYNKLFEAAKALGKEKKFAKAAAKYQASFGYREHPKYVIVYIYSILHNICLEIAEQWVKDGRIEKDYDVFDLHIAEVSKAMKDSGFNIQAAREKNLAGYKITENVKDWPFVFDSRGKIYNAPLEIKDGDIVGDPIAPGKIIGRAKVLKTPFEKPLEPGEILITRATEPSWTPIFINAAGVIMEIGGPLQHGGIIAREYGIPCVSGLMGIMDIVKDGDMLEVDGYNGVVKLLN